MLAMRGPRLSLDSPAGRRHSPRSSNAYGAPGAARDGQPRQRAERPSGTARKQLPLWNRHSGLASSFHRAIVLSVFQTHPAPEGRRSRNAPDRVADRSYTQKDDLQRSAQLQRRQPPFDQRERGKRLDRDARELRFITALLRLTSSNPLRAWRSKLHAISAMSG